MVKEFLQSLAQPAAAILLRHNNSDLMLEFVTGVPSRAKDVSVYIAADPA